LYLDLIFDFIFIHKILTYFRKKIIIFLSSHWCSFCSTVLENCPSSSC